MVSQVTPKGRLVKACVARDFRRQQFGRHRPRGQDPEPARLGIAATRCRSDTQGHGPAHDRKFAVQELAAARPDAIQCRVRPSPSNVTPSLQSFTDPHGASPSTTPVVAVRAAARPNDSRYGIPLIPIACPDRRPCAEPARASRCILPRSGADLDSDVLRTRMLMPFSARAAKFLRNSRVGAAFPPDHRNLTNVSLVDKGLAADHALFRLKHAERRGRSSWGP